MNKTYILILAATLALAACSDDSSNNDTSNNAGADAGVDTAPDASGDADEQGLSVLSIQPNTGQVEGGDQVTISGTGFVDGAKVFFGDAEAEATFVSKFEIDAITPTVDTAGAVDIVVENPSGQSATLTGGFTYNHVSSPQLAIGWCNIQFPDATTTQVDTATESIFGRVYVEGCSEADAHCGEVQAQLGYGPEGSDPADGANAWSWQNASYNADHTDDDNDEYSATLTPDAEGTYSYAYRFSVPPQDEWVYCDLNGVEPLANHLFELDQMGTLTVEPQATNTVDIGWCNLQYPASTSTTAGTATENIYGRVYSSGCTDGDAQCAEITAQLGVGPTDGDPTSDATAYTWVDADYNAGHTSDNNDEYQATLTPADAGTFGYVYRFSGDGGTTWTYCDLDDSSNGFQSAQQGELTVSQ